MVGNPASGPPGDAGLPLSEMEQVSRNIELLPEETLVRIGKGPLVKFTNSCEDIE